MLHKAPEFLLSSLTPLYTNAPDELGHQVVHTQLTRLDTQLTLCFTGTAQWAKKATARPQRWYGCNRVATR